MAKKFLFAALCVALVLSLSGCSFAEKVGDFFGRISSNADDILPNDIELILGQLAGQDQIDENHEIIYSEGYVNMLKSGTYNMVYHLSDGTEVQFGSNGVRCGSSYPDPNYNNEVTYDENGEPIEAEIPKEHIVLYEGIFYYIDDAQKKMFTVNPDNYKAVPFEIPVEGIAFSDKGTADFENEACRFERYTTDGGEITFYYKNAVLRGIVIQNGGESHTLSNITLFNKYLSTNLVSMPANYKIVQYWPAEQ